MTYGTEKWTTNDLAQAMSNAVSQRADSRFVKWDSNSVRFNGFWRNGDKTNVRLWLDRATWHDAKTGEGGGCKEFAKIAFNMDLKEFMHGFALSIPVISIRDEKSY